MGRPPIGKFTAVRLSAEMLERIDALTGPGQRAAFIREAVEAELQRREQKTGRKVMKFGTATSGPKDLLRHAKKPVLNVTLVETKKVETQTSGPKAKKTQ